MALLPLRTKFKGPAPKEADKDIIDEALYYFKANMFARNFEIKSPADRTLIYLTLYIVECLKRLQKCSNKTIGMKEMASFALSQDIPVPGEANFPLNAYFKAPSDRAEEGIVKRFIEFFTFSYYPKSSVTIGF
ncbi:unnamed protein product [Soboliphyme baturini]|uniref:Actin-related protein 2/3 complex subunit 3 n=1 Tax=Soboliphyme baturini TaxID=241478 RepID=A0A183J6N1_9BILA|nr:unnamed protein product [Soboliphyme baturini]